jgi:hypothetical protein
MKGLMLRFRRPGKQKGHKAWSLCRSRKIFSCIYTYFVKALQSATAGCLAGLGLKNFNIMLRLDQIPS